MHLMIVPRILVCSSFLISVCMFTVSKGLVISIVTVIVRAVGAIWLNPFATVLFNVCSTVICVVLCCFKSSFQHSLENASPRGPM